MGDRLVRDLTVDVGMGASGLDSLFLLGALNLQVDLGRNKGVCSYIKKNTVYTYTYNTPLYIHT